MSPTSIVMDRMPPAALEDLEGAVLRAMCTHDGSLLDARVSGTPPRVELLTPIERDPESLRRWVELMGRRRNQLVHDASSPATGVLAALETLLEYEEVSDSTREMLGDARRGMLRLTAILETRDGLLAGGVNAVDGPLDELVTRWADAQARTLDPELERLLLEVDASSTHVRLDASAVRCAIATLVGNAWRHRRGHHADVRLTARAADDWIHLAVEDAGQSLTEEALQRAGELGFSTRGSGVGMGLFVLRFTLADRGAVRLRAHDGGCRAEVFLKSITS